MRCTKLVAVSGVAVLATALAACGSSGGGGGGKGAKTMTLITGTKGDEFYITMGCGAKAEAAKLGVKLNVTGPEKFDPQLQRPIITSVTAQQPDAVLIAPTDTQALNQPLKKMQSNGSKVVLVDTTVNDPSIGVSRISSNNIQGGKVAADALGREMHGKGSALIVSVNPGVSTTDARIKGFQQEIKAKYPNIKLLPVQYDKDDPAKATSIVKATIAAHPDLNGVFADNVLTAEGVATGVKNAGKKGAIKISAFDAGPKQIADLKSGTIQVTVAQDPATIGKDGVDQAMNALDGKPVTKQIGTKLVAITKQNMNKPSIKKYYYKSSC